MAKILRRDIEEENEEARIKVLSISIHASEDNGSLHIHMTKSFEVKEKDGWIQNQEECLKKLGYKLPDESKKKGQYNNRKMTWTDQIRQRWYDIMEEVDRDIKIDRTPDPKNPKTKGKVNRAITQMNELKKQIRELQNEYKTLQREMRSLSKEDRKKREEAIRKSLDKIGKVLGTLSDYVGENEVVDPLKDLHAYETLKKSMTLMTLIGSNPSYTDHCRSLSFVRITYKQKVKDTQKVDFSYSVEDNFPARI